MLSQSDETIAAWKATERTLAVIVDINDTKYTATDINSLKYDAGAYTGETFAIGSTYSNNVQIEFSHLVEDLKLGDIVEVSIGIKVSNKYIYDPLGVFIISSEIKMDRNNNLTTISASDAFCKLEGVYKSKLIYPAKVLDVISEICAMAGAEPNTSELSRLPKLADIPTAIEGQSYRKALGWIAQLYAGYATFDRSGKLTIRTVAEPSYELDPSQYEQSGLTQNEATYKISGIQCQVTTKTTTRDDQAQETTTTLQSGSASGAQIKLENNIMTQARLDDVWQKLKDINFYPFSLNWFGNPAVEAGDWLRLYDKKGNDFIVPNNGYTLEFNGGLSAVSKADQTSGSSQVVSWTGGLMQTIRELQHRNVPDGTVIFPTSVTEPPKNAHFNDVWFKKNGNNTELWIFERQSDGTGEWKRNDITDDEVKKQILVQQTDLQEVREKAEQAYNSAESAHSIADSLHTSFMDIQNNLSTQLSDIDTKAQLGLQNALDNVTRLEKNYSDFEKAVNGRFNASASESAKMMAEVSASTKELSDKAKQQQKSIADLITSVDGVKGQYANLDGRVTQFNAGIDGLNAQLRDTKGQLAAVKLTADGTATNLANAQGDIASVRAKANLLEQQMLGKVSNDIFENFKSSTAQALNSKLTATDLNGYARSSELEQTANGLHASITAVDGKLNSLSLGGRNLLKQSQLGSKYLHDAWYAGFGGVTWNSDTVELNIGDKDCVQIEQRVYDIEPDTDYVFSFDLNWADGQHLDKQGFIFWEFQDREGNHTTRVYRDNWTSMAKLPNTPGRKGKKIVIHTQPDTHMLIFMVRSLKGAKQPFRISKVKFEKGNVPTDWSPAPEDIDNSLAGVNNTLRTYKTDFDLFKDGMSLRVAEINGKVGQLNIQNLVYNSEFVNNAEGWSGIGSNADGSILSANNEYDMWEGSTGLAFRKTKTPNGYLISNNRNFKVLPGQKLSASVQMHVTDIITNGNNKAGLEIWFFDANGNNISHSYQPSQYVDNFRNEHKQLLYCDNVVVPNNANKAYLRLFIFGVANVIFNQPMLTFSSTHLPYTHDSQMIGSLQDKYSALNVKVDGINSIVVNKADRSYVDQRANEIISTVSNKADWSYVNQKASEINSVVANKADMSYVNQKANQLQFALTSLQIGGTNLLAKTSSEMEIILAPTVGYQEGVRYNTTKNIDKDTYTLSFEAKAYYSGQKIVNYFWFGGLGGNNAVERVFESNGMERSNPIDGFWEVTLTNSWKRYWITYKVRPEEFKKSVIVGRRFFGSSPKPQGSVFIRNVKLEQGSKPTDYSPAPEDTSVAITAVKNELTQAINLRVQKNELLSQINLQAGHTLIQSNKIYLDAESVVFSGRAFIPSAAIASLSADKINGGTINGRTVNVTNLNANNITSGTINGQNLSIDLDSGEVNFSKGQIKSNNGASFFDIDKGYMYFYKKYSDYTRSMLLSEASISFGGVNEGGAYDGIISCDKTSMNFWCPKIGELIILHGDVMGESNSATLSVNGFGENGSGGASMHIHSAKDAKQSFFSITTGGTTNSAPSITGGYNWMGDGKPKISIYGEVWMSDKCEVHSDLYVYGSKNSIVDTSRGMTGINAYETAEYYFGDIAKTNTGASKRVKIMIDPLFLETINTNVDYHVFVSSYGNGYAWVSELSQDYFVIESNVPNLSVSYEIKAKRRNYENVRLDTVDMGGTK